MSKFVGPRGLVNILKTLKECPWVWQGGVRIHPSCDDCPRRVERAGLDSRVTLRPCPLAAAVSSADCSERIVALETSVRELPDGWYIVVLHDLIEGYIKIGGPIDDRQEAIRMAMDAADTLRRRGNAFTRRHNGHWVVEVVAQTIRFKLPMRWLDEVSAEKTAAIIYESMKAAKFTS